MAWLLKKSISFIRSIYRDGLEKSFNLNSCHPTYNIFKPGNTCPGGGFSSKPFLCRHEAASVAHSLSWRDGFIVTPEATVSRALQTPHQLPRISSLSLGPSSPCRHIFSLVMAKGVTPSKPLSEPFASFSPQQVHSVAFLSFSQLPGSGCVETKKHLQPLPLSRFPPTPVLLALFFSRGLGVSRCLR